MSNGNKNGQTSWIEYREDGEEPTNWELYRLVVDIHKSLNGNGQPGLIKLVERHDTWLKAAWGALALLIPIVVARVMGI